MIYVEKELQRIEEALREPRSAEERSQLYAAQQALGWALDPIGCKAPYDMVVSTEANSEDCRAESRPASS